MNRREFLKAIAALGGAMAFSPEIFADTPEVVIDHAWRAANENPQIFYVETNGALSISPQAYFPATRAELFGFGKILDRRELIDLAQDEWRVSGLIEQAMSDELFADDEDGYLEDVDWEEWAETLDDNSVSRLIRMVNDWIDEMADSEDYESADISGESDRGSALAFFRDVFEENDLFDIEIVEGDCPGSSYFAAELHMEIDAANALAVEHGIPIRFAWQGV